ncbi:MAG: hypothetical protein CMK89_22490 [Pseudomonadales bacterium]|nr:hypothetical protein [Pseudomonadales bacterium]
MAAEAQPFGGASEPGQIVDWLPTTTVLNKAKVKADPEVASDPPRYEMDHESGVGVPGHLILSLFGVALITIGLLRGKSRV